MDVIGKIEYQMDAAASHLIVRFLLVFPRKSQNFPIEGGQKY